MEVYVPYVIGSSVTAFIGKVAYSYLYPVSEEVVEEESKKKDEIEYNLVDTNLNERKVNSGKDRRPLGSTFKEKMIALQKILQIECKRNYPINNTKKVRARWIRYIKEYETIGHSEFVYNHTSKPYKSR
tara:strand:- start:73 stop:459 length:387 start_codon:yes stop_codon:yes gene_type:complete